MAFYDASHGNIDTAMTDAIAAKLISADYEIIATIDARTGQAYPCVGNHICDVTAEQEQHADNAAGVEVYLRKYCMDEDVERVIRETGMPYVKEQLEKREIHSVAYSLRQNGRIFHKRVAFSYLDDSRKLIICAIQDITELYELESIKRDQIAAALQTLQEQGGMNVARYVFKTQTFYSNSDMATAAGYGKVIENVPEEFIAKGLVAPESADEYRRYFEKLRSGEEGAVTVACRVEDGSFHWLRVDARTICDRDGKPYQAILSFKDIDEEREHTAVYRTWRRSIDQKEPDSYTLFRCNLSKGTSFDKVEGRLLRTERFDAAVKTFNERTRDYAGRFVHLDDFDAYTELLNSENLLAGYYRGTHNAEMDFRERVAEDEYRWLHVSIEMIQYPDSTDIEVFLMYEPSERAHAEDKVLKSRMDTDPLTGVLNRRAFMEQFTELIVTDQPDAKHALILVDVDNFKRINENFGHAVGDQALADAAASLHSIVKGSGLLGRLGGDVFIICLKDVSGQAQAELRAAQMLAILRKVFSVDIRMTASMGVAFYPDDGKDFDTLYHNVDLALYTAKSHGIDSFAFYNGELMWGPSLAETEPHTIKEKTPAKRHMLLADDDEETLEIIEQTFGEQYHIEVCVDEKTLLARLYRYGILMPVVLLSLDTPAIDGLELLDRIRGLSNMNAIPVIALSSADNRESGRRSLRHGANDFVLRPFDPELLSIRVESAVSKAENERLRTQNTYLQTQNNYASQFRSVYENTDTVVVEYDWESHKFVYDPSISKHIYGKYDDRSLWQIFMSDMVADVKDVKSIQELVMDLANSRSRTSASIDIMLKTPQRVRHWYTMNAFKRVNDRNITSKIIMTFVDVNEDILASKKLRFAAEHDSLTGLYNRTTFLKLVTETVRLSPANSYILLCCDINDFRFINERFGRAEGDKLLEYSAESLLSYANTLNGVAGRLSNDVYAILLPNNADIMERTTVVIQDFFKHYPLNPKVTGRAGAFIISDPDMTVDSMLDMAMTAKESIRGKYDAWLAVYDDSMNEKRQREKSIKDRMEAALSDGQFDVYIQPQFHHATGQIIGAEALVRWIDPERGVISPGEFIPVFERNGFITKLDEYVWDRAAQYVSAWMAKGNEPVPVSVNVSREDLTDPELCSKLLAIVEKYNIPTPLFRLEITESLFAEAPKQLAAVVEQLHGAGFLIEMDDFGSGYSSLNILKDVPVDILKLDMKFFSGNDDLGRGGMIINAVLRMSRWLGIPVIAEGVEMKEQADFLLSIGCPTIQGYLYERPMPAADFEKMLHSDSVSGAVPQNPIETKLDAHSFWNPCSADSQLFNNLIGPAFIFEYHDGDYEIVRMNKRFIETIGVNESVMLPVHGLIHFCEADRPKFKKAVLESIYSDKDVCANVSFVAGNGSVLPVQIMLRCIAKCADRALIFGEVKA